jgi:hypothetical protein
MLDRSDTLRLDAPNSDGSATKFENISKTEGVWNNISVVIEGDTSTVYVNGVSQGTAPLKDGTTRETLSQAIGTGSDFFIGLRPYG